MASANSKQLADNLTAVRRRIATACATSGRDPNDIVLVGVSKTKPADAIAALYAQGVREFGENYLDEASDKIEALKQLNVIWHYIGRIQSNKSRLIAEQFDWVHTIDRAKIARRLGEQCPPTKQLNVLLQINIDADPAKAGVLPENAEALLDAILEQPSLIPRGLMTILAQPTVPGSDHQRLTPPGEVKRNPAIASGASYRSMAQLASKLRSHLPVSMQAGWNVLSMGMTGDLEAAIEAGATHVRIGTALFGERIPRAQSD